MKLIKSLSNILFEQGPPSFVKAQQATAPKATASKAAVVAPTISAADLAKEKADLTLKLNAGFKQLSEWLVGMFSEDNNSQWKPWKSWSNDLEEAAWKEFFSPQWKAECAETLKELEAAVTGLTAAVADGQKYANDPNMKSLNTKMVSNLKIVKSWPNEGTPIKGSLKEKFYGNTNDDNYVWTINYSTDHNPSRKTYEIDTDF